MPDDGYFPDGFFPDGFYPDGFWPTTDIVIIERLRPPLGTIIVHYVQTTAIAVQSSKIPHLNLSSRVAKIVK